MSPKLVSTFALSLAIASRALTAETPTIDELVSLKSPGEVALSPDGSGLAYVVTETNWEDDRYEREIWIAREGREPFPFTNAERSSFNPQWSPDSASLVFLSDRTGTNQLYRMGGNGGEAEKLTDLADGVNAFDWSPDGAWIAFAAMDPKGEALEAREKEMGEFSWEDEDHRMTHLWRLDLDTGGLTRLTEGREFTVDDFAVSPDGRRVAFSARPFPDPSAALLSDIFVVDVADGRVAANRRLARERRLTRVVAAGRSHRVRDRGRGRDVLRKRRDRDRGGLRRQALDSDCGFRRRRGTPRLAGRGDLFHRESANRKAPLSHDAGGLRVDAPFRRRLGFGLGCLRRARAEGRGHRRSLRTLYRSLPLPARRARARTGQRLRFAALEIHSQQAGGHFLEVDGWRHRSKECW